MEIGEHRVDSLESESGPDEQLGFADYSQEQTLYRADTGSANADHSLRCFDPVRTLRADGKPLRVQRLAAHRLKGPQADVQRDVGDLRPGLSASIQDLRREMQARGRRRH